MRVAIFVITIVLSLIIRNKTNKDDQTQQIDRTDYSRKYSGKIGPQKIITYDYGDKFSTYIDY